MSTPPRTATLRLGEHPLQRCGAWAMAVLAGRDRPEELTGDDVDTLAERITSDVVVAAMADKDGGAYDWWKVLFALYPNAKPTHAKRSREPDELRPEVAAMFAPDLVEGTPLPCTFCESPCGVLWTKSVLPMFDSNKALNTLPPGLTGWPVCRPCRVALWALPYGAWLTAGSATVLTSESPAVERGFVARNVRRAGRIRQMGFSGLSAKAGPEAVTLQALRTHAWDRPATTTLWMFKNDNQEPWLRVTGTRTGTAVFIRRMLGEPDCRAGWWSLRKTLEQRDKSGQVTRSGATEAARTLFAPDGERTDLLPGVLLRRARNGKRVDERTLLRWRALCRLYLEVMHDMDVDDVKPIAGLLAAWIAAEKNPRGRFNEYRRVAGSGYELHKLLMTASARLYLDGERPVDVTEVVRGDLLRPGSPGWLLRCQLFFEVMAELAHRGVSLGGEHEEGEEAETKFDGRGAIDPLGTEDEYEEIG